MVSRTIQYSNPAKRKISLSQGFKRMYQSFTAYFGLETVSDQLWFLSVIGVFGAVGFITLFAKLQLLFLV